MPYLVIFLTKTKEKLRFAIAARTVIRILRSCWQATRNDAKGGGGRGRPSTSVATEDKRTPVLELEEVVDARNAPQATWGFGSRHLVGHTQNKASDLTSQNVKDSAELPKGGAYLFRVRRNGEPRAGSKPLTSCRLPSAQRVRVETESRHAARPNRSGHAASETPVVGKRGRSLSNSSPRIRGVASKPGEALHDRPTAGPHPGAGKPWGLYGKARLPYAKVGQGPGGLEQPPVQQLSYA